MKLFQTIVSQKKKKGDTSPAKIRPILIAAENAKGAVDQLKLYWGKADYSWTRPNMIADFNPK